jgi:hypothetical protein
MNNKECFNGFFVLPPTTFQTTNYPFCLLYSGNLTNLNCTVYDSWEITNSFSPPFFYNFDCYSAVLSNYIPIFIITYSFSALIAPLLLTILMVIYPEFIVKNIIPPIYYRPMEYKDNNNNEGNNEDTNEGKAEANIELNIDNNDPINDINSNNKDKDNNIDSDKDIDSNTMKLFFPYKILASIIHHLLVFRFILFYLLFLFIILFIILLIFK